MRPALPNELGVPQAYWSQPPEQVLATLHSAPNRLSASEAARRLAQAGPNLLQARSQVTALGTFLHQFSSPITLILLVATLISAVLGDWADTAIILVIIPYVLISSWTDHPSEIRCKSGGRKYL